jgi:hypothetical protein
MGWEDRYNEAIRIFLADHMTVRKDDYSIYSRVDWNAADHMRKCMFDPEMLKGAKVTEETVYEFAGTFVDSDTAVVLWAEPISCMCGHLKGRIGEWEGSFQDLVVAITDTRVETRQIEL